MQRGANGTVLYLKHAVAPSSLSQGKASHKRSIVVTRATAVRQAGAWPPADVAQVLIANVQATFSVRGDVPRAVEKVVCSLVARVGPQGGHDASWRVV